jgi:hypothetical protein
MFINRVRRERPAEMLEEVKGWVRALYIVMVQVPLTRYTSLQKYSCCLWLIVTVSSLCRLTKWVPPPVKMTRSYVEENINRSRKRMDVAALDMLQFHWYVCVACFFFLEGMSAWLADFLQTYIASEYHLMNISYSPSMRREAFDGIWKWISVDYK